MGSFQKGLLELSAGFLGSSEQRGRTHLLALPYFLLPQKGRVGTTQDSRGLSGWKVTYTSATWEAQTSLVLPSHQALATWVHIQRRALVCQVGAEVTGDEMSTSLQSLE